MIDPADLSDEEQDRMFEQAQAEAMAALAVNLDVPPEWRAAKARVAKMSRLKLRWVLFRIDLQQLPYTMSRRWTKFVAFCGSIRRRFFGLNDVERRLRAVNTVAHLPSKANREALAKLWAGDARLPYPHD